MISALIAGHWREAATSHRGSTISIKGKENAMRFEIYQSPLAGLFGGIAPRPQNWRWRLRGGNGEIVASGEGYVSKSNAERAVNRMKEDVAAAPIIHV